jgi:hypothetical protein
MDKQGFDRIRHALDETGALFYVGPEPRANQNVSEVKIQVWEPHNSKFIMSALKEAGVLYGSRSSNRQGPLLKKVGKIELRRSTSSPSTRKIRDIKFIDKAANT